MKVKLTKTPHSPSPPTLNDVSIIHEAVMMKKFFVYCLACSRKCVRVGTFVLHFPTFLSAVVVHRRLPLYFSEFHGLSGM